MELVITEERIARQTPEAQAIIHALLARRAKVEAELEILRRQTLAALSEKTDFIRRPTP